MTGEAIEAETPQTLREYEHADGPVVTHVRGLFLMNSMENLKTWGVYDAYLQRLSTDQQGLLMSTLATSWVPVQHAVLHYEVAQRLDIAHSAVVDAGQRMAERIAEMFLSSPLRAAEVHGGIEVFASVLAKNDKLWERMYRGGGFTTLRQGPRELQLVDRGNPLVQFPVFRDGYVAYMAALANMFEPHAHVREVNAHAAGAMATQFSWC